MIGHATVKPDSSVAPRRMKTYSESRIEPRNLNILLEKSSQFLSSEQPCEPKSLDVALKIAGVEKIPPKTCGRGQPRLATSRPHEFYFREEYVRPRSGRCLGREAAERYK